MDKAIIFSRVSTDQQDLVQQTEAVIEEAHRCGYSDDALITIEHKESAIKLSEDERVGIQELYEYLDRDSDIKCVFVFEISRLSRQQKMLFEIRDRLVEKQIQLICIKPYMRLLENGRMSEMALFMFSFLSTYSESEMMLKKERMMRGRQHARALGRHAAGVVVYGYSTDREHNYIINQREATVIRRIFREYTSGTKSVRQLAREMYETNTFNNITISGITQNIYNILKRECYTGVKKGMPQIISSDEFKRAQHRLQTNDAQINHTANMALCKGLLKDEKINRTLSSNSTDKKYYVKNGGGICVYMASIDPIIWQQAVSMHSSFVKLDKTKMLEAYEHKYQMNERKMAAMHQKYDDLIKRNDLVEERYILGKMSKQKADELHNQLLSEARKCIKRHNEIREEQEKIRIEADKAITAKEIKYDYDNMNEQERYDIVHSVIERVLLNRLSRFVLQIKIHSKIDGTITTLQYDTYNKKYV